MERMKLILKYVARQSTTAYKMGVAPTEYQVHEACIEVAR